MRIKNITIYTTDNQPFYNGTESMNSSDTELREFKSI